MGWSDIPMELFHEIMNRVNMVDVVRVESVCNWWRSVSFRKNFCKPQVPWLMLSSRDDDKIESRFFYSLTDEKIYKVHLPELSGNYFMGSSEGYLISTDLEANLVVTNPLSSGADLAFPPTSTLPDVVGVIRDSCGEITEFMVNPYGRAYSRPRELMRKHYYKKVILSPDVNTAVVIDGIKEILAYANPGDKSWTALECLKMSFFNDMIFHKGRLHAIDFCGTVVVFDLKHPSEPPFVSPLGPLNDGEGVSRRYLVESPCGDNLFLVRKVCQFYMGIITTKSFRVYVLDKAAYTWKQIHNLGEISLFLGLNHSVAISTSSYPGIRKNCIYFTDAYKDRFLNTPEVVDFYVDRPEMTGDKGVFDLQDATIGPLYPNSNLNRLNWPPPMWFRPKLS